MNIYKLNKLFTKFDKCFQGNQTWLGGNQTHRASSTRKEICFYLSHSC